MRSFLLYLFSLTAPLLADTPTPPPAVTLELNIQDGHQLLLSDKSLWEVAPEDVEMAATWILPIQLTVSTSKDPSYPFLLTDLASGASVKVRHLNPIS